MRARVSAGGGERLSPRDDQREMRRRAFGTADTVAHAQGRDLQGWCFLWRYVRQCTRVQQYVYIVF